MKFLLFVAFVVIIATSIVGMSKAMHTKTTCTVDPATYATTCTSSTP